VLLRFAEAPANPTAARRGDGLAARLLGRHVRGRADDRVVRLSPDLVRASKVEEARDGAAAVPRHEEDVRWLDVAVDDARVVDGVHCARELDEDRHHEVEGEGAAARDRLGQCFAPQPAGDDERHASLLSDIDWSTYAGVRDAPGEHLTANALPGRARVRDREELDDDRAGRPSVHRFVDLRHRALCDHRSEHVPLREHGPAELRQATTGSRERHAFLGNVGSQREGVVHGTTRLHMSCHRQNRALSPT
jgi:hypothetical protein